MRPSKVVGARCRARLVVTAFEPREVPTFTVNTFADVVSDTDGKLSLREAVSRANATPGADTIVLQAGTYKIARFGLPDDTNALGDFDVTEAVTIAGQGAGKTFVENSDDLGAGRERMFDVLGTFDVAFANLTLRNGGNVDFEGGAVRAAAANLRFTDCRLLENVARSGGAVHAQGGNVTLVRTTVQLNRSDFDGGGLFLGVGTLDLRTSRLLQNSAGRGAINGNGGGAVAPTILLASSTVDRNGAKGAGGGLRATTVTATDSTFSRNVAGGDGGGLFVLGGEARLTRCPVRDNFSVSGGGGGLAATTATLVRGIVTGNHCQLFGGGLSAVTVNLTDTIVRRNLAGGNGGGVQANLTATVTRGLISGNSSGAGGGGLRAETATLAGVTVSGNSSAGLGGGVFVSDATVADCVLRGNNARAGGGLRANDARLSNTKILNNFASELGGGGVDGLRLSLSNCLVSNNSAVIGGGGVNSSEVDLTDCLVEGNFARESGGGLQCSTATVARSTIRSNRAASLGGGIRAGSVTVSDSTISDNTATDGGGLSAGVAVLVNSTVSGNTARNEGGGISAPRGDLVNVTIADNLAVSGGGVFADPVVSGTFRVHNSIIATNLVHNQNLGADVFGNFTSQGHNIIGDGFGSTGFTAGGDLVGGLEGPLDVKLGPLANNGGPTQTHALLVGNPALDAGDNTAVNPDDDSLLLKDQRGRPRRKIGILGGEAVIDIGAFER